MGKRKLNTKDIELFYYKVLLRFETEIKNPKVDKDGKLHKYKHDAIFLMSLNQTNQLIADYGIKLISKDEIKGNIDTNSIYLTTFNNVANDKYYTYYSLLTHLRNSFAHGNIEKAEECYIMKDYDDKGRLTMIAKVEIKKFFDYVDTIYDESKKYQNEIKKEIIHI